VEAAFQEAGIKPSKRCPAAPRSPESGGGTAGFEVRSTGRHSRTYLEARLARLRNEDQPHGSWPAPKVERFEPIAANYAEEWPAWMHRKIAALTRADGYAVSTSTVERALRRRGLLLPRGYRADRKSWAMLRRKVFHVRRHNAIKSGKRTSANSKPVAVGSGGSAQ
jgi:hypothetical protein